MQHFVRPPGSPPVNGYSHAVAFTGPMVAVSGQVPLDAEGGVVGESDPAAQIRQVFLNLATALHAAGARLQDVVKLTVYLADLADLADLDAFRRIRDEHLDAGRPPACSLVKVASTRRSASRSTHLPSCLQTRDIEPEQAQSANAGNRSTKDRQGAARPKPVSSYDRSLPSAWSQVPDRTRLSGRSPSPNTGASLEVSMFFVADSK
ncbi:RidA family protein [Streptomyces lydicus]|uniref:RidA family protein n=1 Tax=Streptomyces lydicus TaxID=47763 RepID=UPI0036E72274